jgi:hypothetical protein
LAPLVALFVALGCTPNPKDTQAGFKNGFEQEIPSVIELKASPADNDHTAFLTAVDNEITNCLETEGDAIVAESLKQFEDEGDKDQTKISSKEVEYQLENFSVKVEDDAATRKLFEGKSTHFRFTLRRAKARILPDPMRVQIVVSCVERSWAPGDTIRFPQIFRTKVINHLNKRVYKLAVEAKLDPVEPRAPRTE